MFVRLSMALRSRVRGDARDGGIAMIMVLGTIIVLTGLLTAALGYAMQVQPQARKDQDWNAALSAAQAGVDDYVAKLNGLDSYWGPLPITDCANTALAGPVSGANGCGWTSTTPAGWRNVQVGNPKAGKFHYDVDPSIIYSQGAVRLSSTGKVGNVSRTLQVNVSRGGPTAFLYYTDFEDADPGNPISYGPNLPDTNSCGKSGSTLADYWWSPGSRGSGENGNNADTTIAGPQGVCSEITFISADTLDGAVHFNDTPLMNGSPKFLKGYETSDPACPKIAPFDVNLCKRSGGSPNLNGNDAIFADKLDLVDNSAAFATFPGCVYTGDTRIRFKNDGTMDVWNTGSSAGASVVGPGSPGTLDCGTAADFKPTSASDKTPAATAKQNVDVPNDLVIYVKNATGTATQCVPGQIVNGPASASTTDDVIPQGSVSTATGLNTISDMSFFDPDSLVTTQTRSFTRTSPSAAWTPGATTLAGPAPNPSPASDDHPKTFNCGSGNVYIEGTVKGRVTIAAQNNVIVTADLLVDGVTPPAAASGASMVGLVAGNSVIDYHPVHRSSSEATPAATRTAPVSGSANCNGSTNSVGASPSTSGGNGTSMTCQWVTTESFGNSYTNLPFPGATSSGGNRYIYGSIQTLQHSFGVQNYNKGAPLGTLSVRGSIAQRWRGAVGTNGGATGFAKDYSYDTRLEFSGPPYFPQWTNAAWGAVTTGELKPAY